MKTSGIVNATRVRPLPAGARAFEVVYADPSVSGLNRPVGSVVMSPDGAAGWIKYDIGNTTWMSLPLLDMLANPVSQGTLAALLDSYAKGGRLPELIETWTPSVDAQSKDFTINPALYKKLIFETENVGAVAGSVALKLMPDGAEGGVYYAVNASSVVSNASGATATIANLGYWNAADSRTGSFVELRKQASGRWHYSHGLGWSQSTAGTSDSRWWSHYQGLMNAFTSTIRLMSSRAATFRAGACVVKVYGERA